MGGGGGGRGCRYARPYAHAHMHVDTPVSQDTVVSTNPDSNIASDNDFDANMHPCIHAGMHTCIYAYMRTCVHAYMHHTYMHPRLGSKLDGHLPHALPSRESGNRGEARTFDVGVSHRALGCGEERTIKTRAIKTTHMTTATDSPHCPLARDAPPHRAPDSRPRPARQGKPTAPRTPRLAGPGTRTRLSTHRRIPSFHARGFQFLVQGLESTA